MKYLMFLPLCLSLNCFAESSAMNSIDLSTICSGISAEPGAAMKLISVDEKELFVVDQGFCPEYLTQQLEIESSKITSDSADKWKIRFYASHSFTKYFNSDVTFQSTRYNVEIKDYEWAERGSRAYFTPHEWSKPGNTPFKMLDEPSNSFTVSLEKNGHEFFLTTFHPKYIQESNQVKYIKGTIDGVAVDGVAPVNKPFDGYNQDPGESELVRNENTHRQMTFEIGYGYRLKLLDSKIGSISYIPSIGFGVMTGHNFTVMIKQNEWWSFDDCLDRYGVEGFGGSITNRIEMNTKKERFGIFYENKLGYYRQHHGFMDGTQSYNLGFVGNRVGIKFMINNPNNKKRSSK